MEEQNKTKSSLLKIQSEIEDLRQERQTPTRSLWEKAQWPVIVTLLTVGVTLYLGEQQRRSSERIIEAQLESAKTIATAQVKAAELREIKELIARLYAKREDPSFPKEAAVIALASYGQTAVPTLIASLAIPDSSVNKAAQNSLTFIGPSVVPKLEEHIRTVHNSRVSSILIRVINRFMYSPQNLTGAHLELADLDSVVLERTDLRKALLMGANLRGASLAGANLTEAQLAGATLEGADLRGADLRTANLIGVNLRYANLSDADLENADLTRAWFSGMVHYDTTVVPQGVIYDILSYQHGARLQRANLKRVTAKSAGFALADLQGANLEGAVLEAASFFRANLEGAVLKGANLKYANLEKARFTSAIFDDASLRSLLEGRHWETATYDLDVERKLKDLLGAAKAQPSEKERNEEDVK